MTIKRRRTTITMAAATGSVDVGLGSPYARILKFEVKGDDADVDLNTTFAIVDAEGREILAAVALDAGTDDSVSLHTSQDFSTVGIGNYLTAPEVDVIDAAGDYSADTEGLVVPPIAKSPVTWNLAAGTATDVFELTLFVEV